MHVTPNVCFGKKYIYQFKLKLFVQYTVNIFIIVSSPEAMPNVSPTELMNQDTSMLSKQTTLTEEYTQREKGNLEIKRK